MLVDWWSLGIVLYELASGIVPFQNECPNKMAKDIRFQELPYQDYFSETFEDLIRKLTHKLPKLRLGN